MLREQTNHQAKAVRCYIEARDGIEASWNDERHRYDARPKIDEWHNGRENGYVITLIKTDYSRQLNIAFYEHRNSDRICCLVWEAKHGINPPTIDDVPESAFKNKWDVAESFPYGHAGDAAQFITDRMEQFWAS